MDRRGFVSTSLAVASGLAVAGCSDSNDGNGDGNGSGNGDGNGNGSGNGGSADVSFPSYDIPAYSEWPPAEPRTNDYVLFTHLNSHHLHAPDDTEATPEEDVDDEEDMMTGLPFYGFYVTAIWHEIGMWSYPFADDLGSADEPEGMDTTAFTMTEGTFIYHGDYDVDVFAENYSEGYEQRDAGAFTVFEGQASEGTDTTAYAVSESAVVVGLDVGGEGDHDAIVGYLEAALTNAAEESGRVRDTDDGRWLYETTGDADIVTGFWKVNGVEESDLQGGEANGNENESGTPTATDDASSVEDNPVFENVESFISMLALPDDAGGVGGDTAALRFAALYPDGDTPSENELRDGLLSSDLASEAGVTRDADRAHVAVEASSTDI